MIRRLGATYGASRFAYVPTVDRDVGRSGVQRIGEFSDVANGFKRPPQSVCTGRSSFRDLVEQQRVFVTDHRAAEQHQMRAHRPSGEALQAGRQVLQ